MSGIVSLLNLGDQPIGSAQLKQMTDAMTFRGPDAQQSWSKGRVGLGHALLRTTAESEQEAQPLTLDGISIVADARIDDRANLIQILNSKGNGCIRNDAPDVELLLHAYRVWGTNCLDYLIGDFAFILWDEAQQQLFCARDQFGVVPFYYAQVSNTLLCSNTLSCIRLHPQVSTALNSSAIGDFLLFSMNMNVATTSFTDIQRLPPAHWLRWHNGHLHIQRYWSLPEEVPLLRYRQPQDYVEQFYEIFQQAVSDRLRTNRLGTHLSGGLDSTSIAVVAHQVLKTRGGAFDLTAYTLRYGELMPEEDHYARMVADVSNLPVHYVDGDPFLVATPPDQPDIRLPEPSGIPARTPEFGLLQKVASQQRVVLTGFGGDPALEFVPYYWLDWWRQGKFGRWAAAQIHYMQLYGKRPPSYFRLGWQYWQNRFSSIPSMPAWMNSQFVDQVDLRSRSQAVAREIAENKARSGMAMQPFWSNLLSWTDPGNTNFPLKQYFPFFDTRLVHYLLAIPPVPWFRNKELLRQAMVGLLPEPVRIRPKALNTIHPTELALREGGQTWMKPLLTNTPHLQDYVEVDQLLTRIDRAEQLRISDLWQLQNVLFLAYWLKVNS